MKLQNTFFYIAEIDRFQEYRGVINYALEEVVSFIESPAGLALVQDFIIHIDMEKE